MKNLWLKTVVAIAICGSFAACAKKSDGSSIDAPKKTETGEMPPGRGAEDQGNGGNSGKNPGKGPNGNQAGQGQNQNGSQNNGQNNNQNNGIVSGNSTDADTQLMLAEAKKFSGSADDYLRSFLENKQAQVSDEAQKNRNLKLAYGIRSANLKVDYNASGDVAVSIVVGSNDKDQKTILLGGSLDGQREAKLVGASKKSGASGSIKCMDQVENGLFTCENAVVSLKLNKADAKIIFRRTNVALNAIFPNTNCRTQECENMYSLFRQTEEKIHDRTTIKKAKLETAEVIQGRSSFRLVIITNNQEVITVGGPLLNPSVHSVTNIPADRSLKIEDLVDLHTMDNYRTNMQRSLNDVRIVGNNGHGVINLQIKMKMLEDGVQDQFQLDLERLQRNIEPTVESSRISAI